MAPVAKGGRRPVAAIAFVASFCAIVALGVGWSLRNASSADVVSLPASPEDENHWGPAWSPDGRTIAYSAATDGDFEIFLLDLASREVTQLTDNDAIDWRPDWSSDGEWIAFSSDRGGDLDVWIMDRFGRNARGLSLSGASENRVRFSPDGSKLVFDSDRSGSWGVYVANTDGSGQVTVIDSLGFDGYPSWSPDGAWLVLTSDVHDPSGGGAARDLYVVRPDGSDLRRLTNTPGNDQAAAWSPRGDRIAFFSDRDGNPEIYTIRPDGTGESRMTSNDEWDFMPSWSPDGTALAFDSRRDGRRAIWTMSSDGSGAARVTHPATSAFFQMASESSISEALVRLDAARSDDPDVEYFANEELFFLGRGLIAEGRTEEGLDLLRTVVRVDPQHTLGWVILGEAYSESGLTDDARRAFWAALDLSEGDPRATEGLARLSRD